MRPTVEGTWPWPPSRLSGTFTCPLCAALVEYESMHRHLDWHATTDQAGGVDAPLILGAKDGHDDSLPGEPSRTCAPGPAPTGGAA